MRFWKSCVLALMVLFSSHPSEGVGIDDLPAELLCHTFRSFTHKQIVYAFGRLNKKFHSVSQQDWTWRNTHITHKQDKEPHPKRYKLDPLILTLRQDLIKDWIEETQKQGREPCPEFELFLNKIRSNPDLPMDRLYISVPYINDEQLDDITAWLSTNPPLKSLSLVECGLTDPAMKNDSDKMYVFLQTFKTFLESNQTLEELDLGGNYLQTVTASVIKEALEKNKNIKRVNLDYLNFMNELYCVMDGYELP